MDRKKRESTEKKNQTTSESMEISDPYLPDCPRLPYGSNPKRDGS